MTGKTEAVRNSAAPHKDHTMGALFSAAALLLLAFAAATSHCDGVAAQRDREAVVKRALSEGENHFDYNAKGRGLSQAYEIVCTGHGKANAQPVAPDSENKRPLLLIKPVHAPHCG